MNERVGQQVGNYRLVQLLGSGGFADVYLGRQVFLDSPAAIKLLRANLTHEEIEAFRSEARTLVRLIHPNIIRILDFGLEGNTPFIVMDYAPNGTMRQRYPRGQRLPLVQAVEYVRQVANALQHAHNERIIHRDIKPENMLLGRQNEILLSDFGIAVVAQNTLTQSTQEMTGTITYMAPEQLQVHPRLASDQYSLGIVAYEWLSGSPPFTGTFTEIAVKHMTVAPPPLRAKLPELSPEVEGVILTALAKEPTQRFASVHAFALALEQASRNDRTMLAALPPSQVPYRPVAPVTPVLPLMPFDPEQEAPTQLSTPRNLKPMVAATQQGSIPNTPAPRSLYPNQAEPTGPPPAYQAPAPVRRGISRRAAVITGLSALGAVAAGGVAWQIVLHSAPVHPVPITHQTPVVQGTGTASPTAAATPTAPALPGLLEQDTFHREDQPLWGIASDNTHWGGDASTSNDFSISHQTGLIHRTASGHALYTAVLGAAHADAEVLVTAMLDTFANSHIGAILRYQDDNHYYKVLLDGGHLHFLKRIDPQHGPTLGQPLAYTPQPQTPYTIRFRVSGTQLMARAWQADTTEPADWMISATDDDPGFQNGQAGLRPQLDQNATLTATAFQLTAVTS